MNKTRVIPVLLLRGRGLVKTTKFKSPKYIGDPINTVRIFNEKEVDEIIILDISSTIDKRNPDFDLLQNIAGEAFMPLAYGGGVATLDQVKRVFDLGFEKVVFNTSCFSNPDLIRCAVNIYGSQSVVASVDVRRAPFGGIVIFSHCGHNKQSVKFKDHLAFLESLGVGELIVNSIDKDGTMSGYDIDLIRRATSAVSLPVVACGGASCINDFASAVHDGGASAVAAGSLFVFFGVHRAVLVNYPSRAELCEILP